MESYRNVRLQEESGNGVSQERTPASGNAAAVRPFQREGTDQASFYNTMERSMLDNQWSRIRKEKEQLKEDLQITREVQRMCIAMMGESEKQLLRSKLNVD